MGRPRGDTGAETRRRLLAAAEEEFACRGYQGATLKAIAGAAGVTEATLFYHAGSKSGLFAATLKWASVDIVDALTATARQPGSLRTKLAAVAEAAKALHGRPSRAALFAALPAEVRWNPELAAATESVRRPLVDAYTAIAEDGLRDGELPPSVTVGDATAMIESFVTGLGAASAAVPDPGRFAAVMEAYIGVLIGPEGRPASPGPGN